ncbi:MAG: hypothetical protein WC356_06625 [Candidatus Micrarchaeia archaeon]|jgi:hypothetical protein
MLEGDEMADKTVKLEPIYSLDKEGMHLRLYNLGDLSNSGNFILERWSGNGEDKVRYEIPKKSVVLCPEVSDPAAFMQFVKEINTSTLPIKIGTKEGDNIFIHGIHRRAIFVIGTTKDSPFEKKGSLARAKDTSLDSSIIQAFISQEFKESSGWNNPTIPNNKKFILDAFNCVSYAETKNERDQLLPALKFQITKDILKTFDVKNISDQLSDKDKVPKSKI